MRVRQHNVKIRKTIKRANLLLPPLSPVQHRNHADRVAPPPFRPRMARGYIVSVMLSKTFLSYLSKNKTITPTLQGMSFECAYRGQIILMRHASSTLGPGNTHAKSTGKGCQTCRQAKHAVFSSLVRRRVHCPKKKRARFILM